MSDDGLDLSASSGFNHDLMGRVCGIAVIDVIGTLAGAIGVSYLTGWSYKYTIPGAFVLGHVAHQLTDTETFFNRAKTILSEENTEQ